MSSRYIRDFGDVGQLKRPGRINLLLFQNVEDAGDGYPGLQRAIRNWVLDWLHNGLMDENLDMNNYSIENGAFQSISLVEQSAFPSEENNIGKLVNVSDILYFVDESGDHWKINSTPV